VCPQKKVRAKIWGKKKVGRKKRFEGGWIRGGRGDFREEQNGVKEIEKGCSKIDRERERIKENKEKEMKKHAEKRKEKEKEKNPYFPSSVKKTLATIPFLTITLAPPPTDYVSTIQNLFLCR